MPQEYNLTEGRRYSITYKRKSSTNSVIGEYVGDAFGGRGLRIKVRHEMMGRVWYTHRTIKWSEVQRIV